MDPASSLLFLILGIVALVLLLVGLDKMAKRGASSFLPNPGGTNLSRFTAILTHKEKSLLDDFAKVSNLPRDRMIQRAVKLYLDTYDVENALARGKK